MRLSQRHQTGSRDSWRAEGPTSHAEKRLGTLFAGGFYPLFIPPPAHLCVLVCVCDVVRAPAAMLEGQEVFQLLDGFPQ